MARIFFDLKSNKMNEDQFKTEVRRRWGRHDSRKARRTTGLFFLLIGGLLFARASGADIPTWIFSWPMILIVIGLFVGIRHGFRSPAPFILMVIGGIFLAGQVFTDMNLRPYLWPAIFTTVGLFIIFRPRHRRCRDEDPQDANLQWSSAAGQTTRNESYDEATPENSDVLDITTVFGGVKKKVLSKHFRGGDVVSVMGGTEIDLTQADFSGKVRIDSFTMFGGTKLIIPPDWNVQSEVVAIFGGVDDKRPPAVNHDPSKVIFLEGTCLFGGIEIKSF